MNKIRVAVCGATGYSGIELLRLLSRHSAVEVVYITSESRKGQNVAQAEPALLPYYNHIYRSLDDQSIYQDIDAAFLCLPHQPAASAAKRFLDHHIKVIDLSAAYRIEDVKLFEQTYHFTHPHSELIKNAVYGLSEIYTQQIKNADLVANPGCYPTSALLPLIPLYKEGILNTQRVIIDSKSGITGAGRKAEIQYLFGEISQNSYAYKVGNHRHRPEIAQRIQIAAGKPVDIVFTPHILPIDRGILTTIYIEAGKLRKKDIIDFLKRFYRNSQFVIVLNDQLPQIKWITHTNNCMIGVEFDEETNYLVIVSALDNLIKGASGQALQNFNLMFGLNETLGLK